MTVYPVITGEYFSTEEFFRLPANSHIDCKIYYHPQTMTTSQYHLVKMIILLHLISNWDCRFIRYEMNY